MPNLTINFDKIMEREIETLRKHYHASSKAEVIRKALGLLKVASEIDKTKGELIARKDNKESKIIIR